MSSASQTATRPDGRGRPAHGKHRNEFGLRLIEVIATHGLRRPEIERRAQLRMGQLSDYVNGYSTAGVTIATRIIEAMPIPFDDKQLLYRCAARVAGWPLAPEPHPGDYTI